MRTRYSTPLHLRINWTPIHRKDQGTANLCRTNNRTVTTIHTVRLACPGPPSAMYSHARQPRFTSRRPPRIDFSHTFNTSLAPCMAKHRSQQQKRPWLFCFRFLLFPRAWQAKASSSGYAAPSAFERHRRCFARDVELIPLSTCHGLSRRAVTCQVRDKSTRN
jgi:hypothetical protein